MECKLPMTTCQSENESDILGRDQSFLLHKVKGFELRQVPGNAWKDRYRRRQWYPSPESRAWEGIRGNRTLIENWTIEVIEPDRPTYRKQPL